MTVGIAVLLAADLVVCTDGDESGSAGAAAASEEVDGMGNAEAAIAEASTSTEAVTEAPQGHSESNPAPEDAPGNDDENNKYSTGGGAGGAGGAAVRCDHNNTYSTTLTPFVDPDRVGFTPAVSDGTKHDAR